MIHGDEDQTASPEAARRFAQTFGARLIQVPGGDHSLSGPGMPQLVVREALEFYLAPEPSAQPRCPRPGPAPPAGCPALSPVSPQNTTFYIL